MNKIIKKYASYIKNILLYFGASLIPMLLSLASNPLVAMNMSPEDYAITGYYTSFSTLLSPLVVFYMIHYYTKRYFEVSKDERENLRALLLKSLIYFSGVVSIICFFALWGYIKFFNSGSSIPFFPYAMLMVFSLPLTGVYNLMLIDYRMGRESSKYFKISTFVGIISITFTILFVVVIKYGALGKLFASFLANLIFFVYSCYHYRRLFKLYFDRKEFKIMIKFCTPLTIAAMLGFFSNGYDRVFLERIGNNTELGFYVVGVQMAAYISVFQTAIGNTFQPDLFQAIVEKNNNKLWKVIGLLVGSTACIVAIYIFAAPLVVKILTAGRYMMSVKYTQIIALSTLTSAMYYAVSQITIAMGKSRITFLNKVLTTVCSITLFSYLINHYQFIGAAWGMVLSFLISLLGNLLLLQLSRRYSFFNH